MKTENGKLPLGATWERKRNLQLAANQFSDFRFHLSDYKMTLAELKIGQTATILSVGGEGGLRQHFLDMGAYYYAIEQGWTHANERIVVDIGAMNSHIMSYGHIVANGDGRFLVERVQHRAVLDIHMVANLNPIDIATQYRIKPNGAAVPI